jgi:hypothetical protein
VQAAGSYGAPGRIARWWKRVREDNCQREILSSMDQSPLLVRRRSRALSPDASHAQTDPDSLWQVALAPPPLKGGAISRPDARDALLRLVSDEAEKSVNLMESCWRLLRLEGVAARAEIVEQAVVDVKGSDEKALTEKWIDFFEHRLAGRDTHLKTRAQVRPHLQKIALYKHTVKHAQLTFAMIGGL